VNKLTAALSILSLIVAALAVFIGPLISLKIARRQVLSSLEVANKQLIAPMRQAWINALRDLLSELSSSALHYYVAGYEERSDQDYQRLTLLEHKVLRMLNAKEEDHRKLEHLIRAMVRALGHGEEGRHIFESTHPAMMDLAREILKREWDRVRLPIGGL
jgi:Zn-dependent protease with chaperone function